MFPFYRKANYRTEQACSQSFQGEGLEFKRARLVTTVLNSWIFLNLGVWEEHISYRTEIPSVLTMRGAKKWKPALKTEIKIKSQKFLHQHKNRQATHKSNIK